MLFGYLLLVTCYLIWSKANQFSDDKEQTQSMKYIPFALFLLISIIGFSQDAGLRYDDYIYKDNIKSVQFHIDGLFTSYPIIDLGANAALAFSFDDIDADVKNYTYTLVHCDQDWRPSNLSEMEYIDGFVEDRIDAYEFSFKTITPFTHYRLYLPNQNQAFTKSGNYLLKVYEDEGEKTLAITRRFVVVEPVVRIAPQMVRPSTVSKMRTHQELDFVVDFDRLNIRSPQQEVRATVLQNGRWDNAVYNVAPLFFRGTQLIFDYQDKIVFPAGKEFRYLDLRSLRTRSENIAEIQQLNNTIDVLLYKDEKRFDKVYLNRRDLNGQFVIESFDQQDYELSGNYADVLFTLYSPEPLYDYDIYLFGELSDWRADERFKMAYNNSVNGYVAKVKLKQGYYDYAYAAVKRDAKQKTPDLGEIEGHWYETENQYTVLIYYRPFGERYDRVIGAVTFTSTF